MTTAAGRAASMVEIHKHRLDGTTRPHWWQGRVVDRDERGTWILVEARTPFWFEHGWAMYVVPAAYLIFRPSDDQDWVAAFGYINCKLDLTTQHRLDLMTKLFELWDVELDVVWRWDCPARIVDQDEFAALSLPPDEASRFEVVADEQRRQIDAGGGPFSRATRDRLFDLAGPPAHPSHATAWMGGVNQHLTRQAYKAFGVDQVDPWLERQRHGEGWLLAGGQDLPSALAWIAGDTAEDPVAALASDDPEAKPVTELVMQVAEELQGCPHPPPIPRVDGEAAAGPTTES